MADRDYYEVLGVARDATAEQIKKAYRALARKHHPDANPGDKTAEAKFKEVQNAYDILSDPEKKARFDQFGHAAFEGGGPFGPRSGARSGRPGRAGRAGFENIDLSSFFGPEAGGGPASGAEERRRRDLRRDHQPDARRRRGGRRRPAAREPGVAEASLTIPFLTAVRGGETTIELEREGGRRETKVVKIPAGLDSGAKIRLRGQGDPSRPGRPDHHRRRSSPTPISPGRPESLGRGARSPSPRRSSGPRSRSRPSTASRP